MRFRLVVALLTAGCLETPPSPHDQDPGPADAAPIECVCPSDPCPFDYVRPIRVVPGLAIAEELSSPPVLIRFETDDHMAPDGSDLRFAAPAGSFLAHEIELFPPTGGDAVVWVGIPLIPAGGEAGVCMFHGADTPGALPDPAGVWDSSFAAVWHLGETSTGAEDEFADSTALGCSGFGGGGLADKLPDRVTATIGDGQAFVPDDLITFGNGSHLDLTGEGITIEAWMHIPAFAPDYMAIVNKEGFYSGYRLLVGRSGELRFQLTNADRLLETDSGSVTAGSWHHIAATYDGVEMAVYVDGLLAEKTAAAGALDSNENPLLVGHGDDGFPLAGTLDEVRISTVGRSAGWIEFQHAMATGARVTVGEEQPAQ